MQVRYDSMFGAVRRMMMVLYQVKGEFNSVMDLSEGPVQFVLRLLVGQ